MLMPGSKCVRKVYLEPLEDESSDHEKDCRHRPEVEGEIESLPEPDLVHHGVTIAVHDIKNRIKLKDRNQPARHSRAHIVDIPHDRRHPHLDLYND